MLLDPTGKSVVAGLGAAYFFEAARKPSACRSGVPLTFADISVYKLVAGEKFAFTSWTGSGLTYGLSVDSGILHSTQSSQSIY